VDVGTCNGVRRVVEIDSYAYLGRQMSHSCDFNKIDEFMRQEMFRRRIPGAMLGIMRNGQIVQTGFYGLANVELNVPVTPQSMFQAASIGKQFTVAALLQFVSRKEINLDDSIHSFFHNAPTYWRGITIQHLLTHTSGLGNYDEQSKLFDYKRDYSKDQLVAAIADSIPTFAPGRDWSYSNSGYTLLGFIIEKLTGRFYGDYLRAHVWRPASMSTIRIMSNREIIQNRSAGYELKGGNLKNAELASESLNRTADGTEYWTMDDALRWETCLAGARVIPEKLKQNMWSASQFNGATTNFRLGGASYGFAWFIDNEAGHSVYYHSGAWAGFVAYSARYPDDHVAVIVCANLSDAPIVAIGRGVARRVLDLVNQRPIDDCYPILTRKLGDAMRSAKARHLAEEMFAPEFSKERIPGLNRAIRRRLAPLGELQLIELLEKLLQDDVLRVRYRLRFPADTLRFEATCDRDSRLAGPLRFETE